MPDPTVGQNVASSETTEVRPRIDVMQLAESQLRACAALWHELVYAAEGGATDAELGRLVHDLWSAD